MDEHVRLLLSDMLTAAIEPGRKTQDVTRIELVDTTDNSVRMLVFFKNSGPREFLMRITEIW